MGNQIKFSFHPHMGGLCVPGTYIVICFIKQNILFSLHTLLCMIYFIEFTF